MYITQALNHAVNDTPDLANNQELVNNGDNNLFEQMLTSNVMQQVANITNSEMGMNKDSQHKDKPELISQNDEESEEETPQYLGSLISTSEMLSSIADFQRDSA